MHFVEKIIVFIENIYYLIKFTRPNRLPYYLIILRPMKNHPTLFIYLFACVLVPFMNFSCAKDADMFADYVRDGNQGVPTTDNPNSGGTDDGNSGNTDEENSKSFYLVPPDFDWNNIPSDLSNSEWEVADNFDLGGQTITLPENVTLIFSGGILANGTLTGNNTIIDSTSNNQIFDSIDLAGTLETEYLKPEWFGAAMDGTTDDRAPFVETLAESRNINAKVLIDKDIFLDVEELGTKSIFMDDNTWLEGSNNSSIIINNLLSPAFIMALTKGITIKNIDFVYDQSYNAAFGYDSSMNAANQHQLETYLSNKYGIKFSNEDPFWSSPINFRYTFLLSGAQNITLENVTLRAKGDTPDKFMVGAIKLKEEFIANSTVTTGQVGPTDICRNISLKNVTFDGVIMGIQGIVDGFRSEGLVSLRYSDVQTSDGNLIGGNIAYKNYWMPPPHLIYLNEDSSKNYLSQNIEILDTNDHGNYVGSPEVRETLSGYCNSLKLTGDISNVIIEGYTSHRRDGFADLQNITNGTFRNIHAESNIEIFKETYKFNTLRFLGTLSNVFFENMTIKDNSSSSTVYPLDATDGNYVSLNDVEVFGTSGGCFTIRGLNNSIENSNLVICN